MRPPCLAAVLLWLLAPAAIAAPPVWAVTGGTSTVYLYGSMHLLPAGEFELSGELARAWADAERILLEVDLNSLTPAEIATVTAARAIDPARRSLDEQLGGQAAAIREAATAAGYDLDRFRGFEPWFVGLTVAALALEQRGFRQAHGVEQVLQRQARADGKLLAGLETLDEQLAALDGLSPEYQADLLLKSLQDSSLTDREIEGLLEAWRRGDDAALAKQLETEFDAHPELAELIVHARNRRWAERIDGLLSGRDDHLVVVGALHLVGERGLPALLRERGWRVERRAD